MNVKKILFPTDFSEGNASALDYASSLAHTYGAVLHIVHVDDLSDLIAVTGPEGYVYTPALGGADRRELKAQLEKVKPTIANVAYEHHFLRGVPSAEIRDLAESDHVDLIVMSSHGRTGLSRLLMGSVAENVLRHAKCPVLVVKQPAVGHEATATEDTACHHV